MPRKIKIILWFYEISVRENEGYKIRFYMERDCINSTITFNSCVIYNIYTRNVIDGSQ